MRKDEVQSPVKAEISCSYLLLAGIYQLDKLEELPFGLATGEEGKLFIVESGSPVMGQRKQFSGMRGKRI
jgi:hypothetical protein